MKRLKHKSCEFVVFVPNKYTVPAC